MKNNTRRYVKITLIVVLILSLILLFNSSFFSVQYFAKISKPGLSIEMYEYLNGDMVIKRGLIDGGYQYEKYDNKSKKFQEVNLKEYESIEYKILHSSRMIHGVETQKLTKEDFDKNYIEIIDGKAQKKSIYGFNDSVIKKQLINKNYFLIVSDQIYVIVQEKVDSDFQRIFYRLVNNQLEELYRENKYVPEWAAVEVFVTPSNNFYITSRGGYAPAHDDQLYYIAKKYATKVSGLSGGLIEEMYTDNDGDYFVIKNTVSGMMFSSKTLHLMIGGNSRTMDGLPEREIEAMFVDNNGHWYAITKGELTYNVYETRHGLLYYVLKPIFNFK